MPYNSEQQEKLKALLESVESRKPHQNAAPTYLDSAALAEIRQIVEDKLSDEQDWDHEALEDSVAVLRYLADSYESMNKIAYAVKMYSLLLLTETEAIRRYDADRSQLEDDFYSAVRARNYYSGDICTDLSEIVLPFSDADKVSKVVSEIMKSYPRLKRDPVELTERYLAFIDEVDEKIDRTRKTGLCHEYWSLKKQYLASRGVNWRSPSEMNPGVLFD